MLYFVFFLPGFGTCAIIAVRLTVVSAYAGFRGNSGWLLIVKGLSLSYYILENIQLLCIPIMVTKSNPVIQGGRSVGFD